MDGWQLSQTSKLSNLKSCTPQLRHHYGRLLDHQNITLSLVYIARQRVRIELMYGVLRSPYILQEGGDEIGGKAVSIQ